MAVEVAIAGIGIHPFGRHESKSLIDLAVVALDAAFDDAGVEMADIGTVFAAMRLAALAQSPHWPKSSAWVAFL